MTDSDWQTAETVTLTNQQIKWILRVGSIARSDYNNARYVSSWIRDILDGKDMTEELAESDW